MASVHEQVVALTEAPLASLIRPHARVRVTADQWDLPEPDRVALAMYGLPDGPLLRPAPQADAQPTLVPNIAGDRERRLLPAQARLYRLGIYGADFDPDLTIRVGAVAGTGQIMGIRARPVTVEDVHPQLRPYHPNLYNPAVCYFNRSLAAFLEVAWRWYAAVEVLRANREPDPTAPMEEHERHDADVRRSHEEFLARMTVVDPTLGEADSIWVETIIDDY